MLLMEAIDSFSICYLFKGETYSAKQKLNQFTERLKDNNLILQAFQKGNKTSQVLEINDIPQLKSLITDVFIEGRIT